MGTRYRLFETIRQYGEERLADRGETAALQVRHAAFRVHFSAHAAVKSDGQSSSSGSTDQARTEEPSLPHWRMPSFRRRGSGNRVGGEPPRPKQGRGTKPRDTRSRCDAGTRHAGRIRTAGISLRAGDGRSQGTVNRRLAARRRAMPTGTGGGGKARFVSRSEDPDEKLQSPGPKLPGSGAYADAVSAYDRAAELADAEISRAGRDLPGLQGQSRAPRRTPPRKWSRRWRNLSRRATLRNARRHCDQSHSLAMTLADCDPNGPRLFPREHRTREHAKRRGGNGLPDGCAGLLPGWVIGQSREHLQLELWWVALGPATNGRWTQSWRALAGARSRSARSGRGVAWCGLRRLPAGDTVHSLPDTGERNPSVNYFSRPRARPAICHRCRR